MLEEDLFSASKEVLVQALGACECCGKIGPEVQEEASRTCREPEWLSAWQRLLRDEPWAIDRAVLYREANPSSTLCRDCAAEYHAEWDALWKEYYQSRF